MNVSIGYRLFAVLVLAIMAVAALGLGLVRWTVFDNFGERQSTADLRAIERLVETLEQRVGNAGWTFLPDDPATRFAWWQSEVLDAERRAGSDQGTPSYLPARTALLDSHEQRVAGRLAERWVIAFASLDVVRRPIRVNGAVVGYVVLAQPQIDADNLAVAFLIERQARLRVLLLLAIVSAAFIAGWLSWYLRRPIRALLKAIGRLEAGQWATELSVQRKDELGDLARAFNRLVRRLAELESARRVWVATSSHDLRTPLAVLRAQLESFHDGVRTPTPANLALMQRQVDALGLLVDELHTQARYDLDQVRYTRRPADLAALIRQVLSDFTPRFAAADMTLVWSAPDTGWPLACDAGQLRRVLGNLLDNCLQHCVDGASVQVSGLHAEGHYQLHIDDSGPGVPDAALARLGERFFRVEPASGATARGSGLGLAQCQQIIAAHGGRLSFAPSAMGGLRVTLYLSESTA